MPSHETVETAIFVTFAVVATLAVPVSLILARRKQKRRGGFPDHDPGLGPWNALPVRAHDRTVSRPAPRSRTSGPVADLDSPDPVVRIRAQRRAQVNPRTSDLPEADR
ncbi:hypothetical protein V1Y59_01850 [Gordonia sp. PKS22-38]|uniref:Secreted protein n=1 Tax=Gordonia prachuapensis TaxID=3115651 RepID=A0ABU7MNB5_9ACTN|nr:hypothetical protein [Gordonia sp. PKS22-38]